jgi:hypothetical protein
MSAAGVGGPCLRRHRVADISDVHDLIIAGQDYLTKRELDFLDAMLQLDRAPTPRERTILERIGERCDDEALRAWVDDAR